MLQQHYFKIPYARKEPCSDFDTQKATRAVRELLESIAKQTVKEFLLKKVPEPKVKKVAQKRLLKSSINEEKKKRLHTFTESWNKWRDFYFESSNTIVIKNNSQIGLAIGALEHIETTGHPLDIYLACLFKGYTKIFSKKKFRPSFASVKTHGDEFFEQFYDDVIADIDEANYKERALG